MQEIEKELIKINEEFKKNNIPHKRRPFEALSKLSKILNKSIEFNSEVAKFVFKWFEDKTKENSNKLGNFGEFSYFYDGEFWKIQLPVFYGTVAIDPLSCIVGMSTESKCALNLEEENIKNYLCFFADSLDIKTGVNCIENNPSLPEVGKEFFMAGIEEFNSATSSLLSSPINKRAIMQLRNAVEMFLKGFLYFKNIISTENEARNIGHNLKRALEKTELIENISLPNNSYDIIELFPNIPDRYKEQNILNETISKCYNFSLFLCAIICREYSGSNSRNQIK